MVALCRAVTRRLMVLRPERNPLRGREDGVERARCACFVGDGGAARARRSPLAGGDGLVRSRVPSIQSFDPMASGPRHRLGS